MIAFGGRLFSASVPRSPVLSLSAADFSGCAAAHPVMAMRNSSPATLRRLRRNAITPPPGLQLRAERTGSQKDLAFDPAGDSQAWEQISPCKRGTPIAHPVIITALIRISGTEFANLPLRRFAAIRR